MWPFRQKKTRHSKVANISSELFPPDFSSELRVAAFRADNESACARCGGKLWQPKVPDTKG
jgi:hypothetical protein